MNDYKDLLFTDICARLKYNIKAKYQCFHIHSVQGLTSKGLVILCNETNQLITTNVENIRLFLFPLSSMTEEQEKECQQIKHKYYYDDDSFVLFDWYNRNHFDYRGLIEKGLAIDATNKNIY